MLQECVLLGLGAWTRNTYLREKFMEVGHMGTGVHKCVQKTTGALEPSQVQKEKRDGL